MTVGFRRALRASSAALVAAAALAFPSCNVVDDIDDAFKTCHDWQVRLLNDEQSIGSVHIIGPEETATEETLLASGQSRSITLCLELGHEYSFRVIAKDGSTLAAAKCAASRSHYDGITLAVDWTPIGVRCINW